MELSQFINTMQYYKQFEKMNIHLHILYHIKINNI